MTSIAAFGAVAAWTGSTPPTTTAAPSAPTPAIRRTRARRASQTATRPELPTEHDQQRQDSPDLDSSAGAKRRPAKHLRPRGDGLRAPPKQNEQRQQQAGFPQRLQFGLGLQHNDRNPQRIEETADDGGHRSEAEGDPGDQDRVQGAQQDDFEPRDGHPRGIRGDRPQGGKGTEEQHDPRRVQQQEAAVRPPPCANASAAA